jgi:hypothetical protein
LIFWGGILLVALIYALLCIHASFHTFSGLSFPQAQVMGGAIFIPTSITLSNRNNSIQPIDRGNGCKHIHHDISDCILG